MSASSTELKADVTVLALRSIVVIILSREMSSLSKIHVIKRMSSGKEDLVYS
jgi:hypothetical protein